MDQIRNENNAREAADPCAGTPNLDFDPIRRLREKAEEPGGGVWAGPLFMIDKLAYHLL